MGVPVTLVLNEALKEIGVVSTGETPQAAMYDDALSKLNQLLDQWSAVREMIYAVSFDTYTLVPGLQPHTIGPGTSPAATFPTVGSRPVRVVSAQLVLTNVTPNVTITVRVQDADWWASVSVQNISTTTPTDLYYEPSWPNGKIFIWGVPSVAYGLQLETWSGLDNLDIESTLWFPQGYQKALTLTLAEDCIRIFGAGGNPEVPGLMKAASDARIVIARNNAPDSRISTKDSGIPTTGAARIPTFNYLTRQS